MSATTKTTTTKHIATVTISSATTTMAAVTPNGLLCAVCRDPTGGDGGDAEALTCGHVFHSYCIHRCAQVHHLQLEELPCPLCKQTAGSQVPVIEIHIEAPAAEAHQAPHQAPAAEAPDALQLQGLLWPPAAGDPQAPAAEAPSAFPPAGDVAAEAPSAFPPAGDVAGEAPQAPAAEAPQAPAAGEVPQAPAEAPQAPARRRAWQPKPWCCCEGS